MAEYESFWVVVGTAAPIIALAHAVAISNFYGSTPKTVRSGAIATVGASMSLTMLWSAMAELGGLPGGGGSRFGTAICVLVAAILVAVQVSILASDRATIGKAE
ncbi:MAG: hypothetical protein ACR2IK_20445 [Chloroflexota bacterium]